ncbi:MAG: 2-amino-4-hydroxy-6-hydroxymethyldihydropteridine diphosphokinase [Sulfuricellaceae bacterium]|nr:2-amino-4-hydroxy-6-hydroxymethyldihydropteridine diphosphokinase [Sulfuricellaceae bacterium]
MGNRAFIGLGSNLDDPRQQVLAAFRELDSLPGTHLAARSSLYRSAPMGFAEQPDFINAVAEIRTRLSPHDLLQALLGIEHRRGRVRSFSNAPRVLDLDVLLYDGQVMHEDGLTVPHPRIRERAFVLRPLLEIAPDCLIPGCGLAADFLPGCTDQQLERLEE